MAGIDPLSSSERPELHSVRNGDDPAQLAGSVPREQQLAAALEERLNASIRRIRSRLAGVADGAEPASGPSGTGVRLNILA